MLRWISVVAACLLVTLSAAPGEAKDLDVLFSWKDVDFKYPNEEARKKAIQTKQFIPKNNIPVGIEVWKDKIFLTVPRWKSGVAASLTYIKMDDKPDSPMLNPYPNWAAHNQSALAQGKLVSPFRVQADSCDRLWVIDSGKSDILGEGGRDSVAVHPQVLVYDLTTDTLLRNYTLPLDQATERSFFASLAVDVVDCTKTWAYLGDLGDSGMVVYDWEKDNSWRVAHEYFHMDPLETNFNVAGVKFQFKDGLFGLALSEIDPQSSHRTLFFHSFSSANEFQVSTKYLRDKAEAMDEKNHDKFQYLGNRGRGKQASASFVDEKSGVLFYTQVNQNAIGCWNYHNGNQYSPSTQALVGKNDKTMNFPNDLKVDRNGMLWVISDKMPMLLFTAKQEPDANFRVLRGKTSDLVEGTVCEEDNLKSRFLAGDNVIIMPESETSGQMEQLPCRSGALQLQASTLIGWTVLVNVILCYIHRK